MSVIPRVMLLGLDLLAVLFGAGCLVAALLAQGGRFNARLDLFSHFALIWLCGGLAVLLYGLVSQGPRPFLIGLGLATMAAALALMAPEYLRPLPKPAPASATGTIKIIQFNAWRKNADVQADVDWLISESPDVIAIQELTPEFRDALMARGGYFMTRGRLSSALFTKAIPVQSPIEVTRPGRAWPDLASATLPSAAGDFTMIGMHLTWPTYRGQAGHRETLLQALERVDRSKVITVGDFNLTPWSFALQDFDRRSGMIRRDRAIFSWPGRPFWRGRLRAPVPFLPIDHVYAGSAWRTVSIARAPKRGSDHYPLVVVLAPAS
ncbi:MAG: hypothetical protein CFE28_11205 [Alphaproteobacteria bacterium PA2]|nr:MAG: hypothetical protein CFE28_11205 [Alphaproteobacteria bacterium PA2]